jgi:hypothetical protein
MRIAFVLATLAGLLASPASAAADPYMVRWLVPAAGSQGVPELSTAATVGMSTTEGPAVGDYDLVGWNRTSEISWLVFEPPSGPYPL